MLTVMYSSLARFPPLHAKIDQGAHKLISCTFYCKENGFAYEKRRGPKNPRTQAAVTPVITVENIPVVAVDSILEHEQMSKHYSFMKKQVLSWNIHNAKRIYYVRIQCDQLPQGWAHQCRAPAITITGNPINPDNLLAEFDCSFICGAIKFQISRREGLPVSCTEETGLQSEMSEKQSSPPQPLAKFSSTSPFLLSLQWENRLHGETTARPSQGTVQFLDSILVRFQGTMDLDVVEETVHIEGSKIGHAPMELTRTERQRRMRWGGF